MQMIRHYHIINYRDEPGKNRAPVPAVVNEPMMNKKTLATDRLPLTSNLLIFPFTDSLESTKQRPTEPGKPATSLAPLMYKL